MQEWELILVPVLVPRTASLHTAIVLVKSVRSGTVAKLEIERYVIEKFGRLGICVILESVSKGRESGINAKGICGMSNVSKQKHVHQ